MYNAKKFNKLQLQNRYKVKGKLKKCKSQNKVFTN